MYFVQTWNNFAVGYYNGDICHCMCLCIHNADVALHFAVGYYNGDICHCMCLCIHNADVALHTGR